MKRIKRILCVLVLLLGVILLSGCKKDYNSITYKKFVEKMTSDFNYSVTDSTKSYEDIYQRYYTAIDDNVIITYLEFETEEDAKKYVEETYKDEKYFLYTDKDDYINVKSGKDGYFNLTQVDNTVVIGSSEKKADKKVINKIFKSLGY